MGWTTVELNVGSGGPVVRLWEDGSNNVYPPGVIVGDDGLNVAAVTAGKALRVDATDTVQPITTSSLPLPDGAATDLTLSDMAAVVATAANQETEIGALTAIAAALESVTISSSLPAGTQTIGGVNVVAAATGGWTPHSYLTTASTNGTSGVVSGACRLHAVEIGNSTGTAAWLKIYDATSVTPGSGTPKLRYFIPASAAGLTYRPDAALGTGLSFSVVGAAADNDSSNAPANIAINLLASA